MTTFAEFVQQATGHGPYPYQSSLGRDGLPELLRAPTGSGKTLAAVLPWLWRRRRHPDPAVRASMPRWLILAQPFRTLVDQVESEISDWLARLEMADAIDLHVLMGGRGHEKAWTESPERDAIFVGSIDMLLSRALNRGYAASRYHWPIDFGMFNSDSQWVFDEVQLLGPALATSRQLQAFRTALGTIRPTQSMWMSATVESSWLSTIDAPDDPAAMELGPDDRDHPALAERLEATRTIGEVTGIDTKNAKQVAAAIVERHRPGTRTITVVNTVKRARDVAAALARTTDVDVALVHSRFRPVERAAATERALATDMPPTGRVIVATQTLEAGVDITSTTLLTDAAPWTSIVQRAGRCNRDGRAEDAQLWWFEPATPAPYDQGEVDAAIATLRRLEGGALTGTDLAAAGEQPTRHHPVLRRRDLDDLFDTTPSLGGEDIDIGPYIRDGDDRDVFVFWRAVAGEPDDEVAPNERELCRVSIADAMKWVKKVTGRGQRVWRFDPEATRWQSVRPFELRPAQVVMAESSAGGYTVVGGWDPSSNTDVPPVVNDPTNEPVDDLAPVTGEGVGADPLSRGAGWVRLPIHLADTAREADRLAHALAQDLMPRLRDAVIEAAGMHDIGKCHPVFQDTLRRSAGHDEDPAADVLWAKSSGHRSSRHRRPHHRHELVGLAQLSTPAGRAMIDGDVDLVRYLVAAHHGKVRIGIRPLTNDVPVDGAMMALGVLDGDEVPAVELEDGRRLEPQALAIEPLVVLGSDNWGHTARQLVDRVDLGPFRLAWLEAIVRLADWAASNAPSELIAQPNKEVRT